MTQRAAEIAEEAAALAPRVSDPGTLRNMYVNVARRYVARGDYDEATRASSRRRRSSAPWGEFETGVNHLARGIVLSHKGSLKRARRQLLDAVEVFARTENLMYKANALAELGRLNASWETSRPAKNYLGAARALKTPRRP